MTAVRTQLIPVYPESEGLTNRQVRENSSTRRLKKFKITYADELKSGRSGAAAPKKDRAYAGHRSLAAPHVGSRMPMAMRNRREDSSSPKRPPPIETDCRRWIRERYELTGRFKALENIHDSAKGRRQRFYRSKVSGASSPHYLRRIFSGSSCILRPKKWGLQREGAHRRLSRVSAWPNKLRKAITV